MARQSATRKDKPIDVEVLDAPTNTDQQLVTTDGDKLREFLGGLTRFFTTAMQLERQAKERLDRARQLTPPADAESDVKIQTFIRESKAEIKVAEDHWTIAAVLHHLHRTVTAARGRTTGKDTKGVPTGMLDQAADIAQQLHNRYVEDENRKARLEEDRLRREAEDRARQDRERELARLEEQAVVAEGKSPELSERETSFVDLVFRLGLGNTDAARRAGFKNPEQAGERLMGTPKILAALDAKKRAAVIREQATATKEMPISIEAPSVRPNIIRTAGGFDRSTYSADIYDADAFISALLDPRTRTTLGIPADVATFLQPKMNEYATAMKELINKWPGVRLHKKTSTV